MGILDFIFTQGMYTILGKILVLLFIYQIIRSIHKIMYDKIRLYSYFFDYITMPYAWFKINYVLMPKILVNWYKLVSNVDKPNKNFIKVKELLDNKLTRMGYTELELENFRIEYKNSLKNN